MSRDADLFTGQLLEAFGPRHVQVAVPLAPFTTFKVGGPADWLFEPHTIDDTVRALELTHRAGVPVTMLGGGSNVLVSDRGVRGLVLRSRSSAIVLESPDCVRAESGVTVNGLVRWTLNRGLAGLEAWAGTPGTIGGGIFGNAHYGGRLLGELIDRVQVIVPAGRVRDLGVEEMEFAYDESRLQRTQEVALSAVFRVTPGDPAALRAVARESLAYRKRTQPLGNRSAGCIFQNLHASSDNHTAAVDTTSAGALIDRAGLKGQRIGAAQVSLTHGNFIVNEGGATADDIRRLIELCRERVRTAFGVELREEIVYLGDFRMTNDE